MNRVSFFGGPVPFFVIVAVMVIGAAVSMSQPALAASAGECVTANVNAPFRLPNGLLYPAGSLTLCDYRALSPVGNLHRISADGSPVGLFLSRKRDAETASLLPPEILFNRDAEGNLELIGYSVPSSGHMVVYRLRGYRESLQASAHRRHPGAATVPPVAAIIAAGTR
jgi:hypothetical protein